MSRPPVSEGAPLGHSLSVSLVQKKVCGSRREELTEGWRKLRNEEHHGLHCSPNIVRIMKSKGKGDETGEACSMYGREEKFTQALVGNLYGNITLVRPKHKWEHNIEMDPKRL
jgi:hypothetical protein